MMSERTVVLLHGAGTGAWVWERVVGALPISAIALDVPGRTADATPDSCANQLVAELDRRRVGPVVLVLHSLAGVLAPALSAGLGARLEKCVFVSGVIPPEGSTFADALGFPTRLILRMLFKFNPDGLKPSEAMIRRELCNDLTEQDAALVVSRYEAERPGLYLTPVQAPPARLGCAYVKLLKDRSVAPALQDRMIARLDNCRVHEISAGHLVMLSQPAALADILRREAAP